MQTDQNCMLHGASLPPARPAPKAPGDGGFTMIEVLVAATLLIIGSFATLALLDNGNRTTATTKQRDVAIASAQEIVERTAGGRYTATRNDMTDVDSTGSITGPADRARTAMGDATSAVSPATTLPPATQAVAPAPQSWTLRRSNTDFRVTYVACTLSDRVDGVEIKGPYDCSPIPPSGGGGGGGGGGGTSNGCTVATTPIAGSGSVAATAATGAVNVSLQLLGALGLRTCLDLGHITDALSPAVCSLATAGALGAPLASLVGNNGLLGGLARVNAGVGNCPSLVEPTLRGPLAGAATATRVTIKVEWTDREGVARSIDRTSLVRRPA